MTDLKMRNSETMANAEDGSAPGVFGADLRRTARITGMLYLGFFVAGILGTLVVPAQLFVADDPAGTWANLVDHESLARVGILLELGIVVAQALTALWFFRLFRSVDSFAAGAIAVFGMVNAAAILGSAALLATALDAAGDASLAGAGAQAATVQLLYVASGHLWGVGGVFFGLWLIPMGWLVIRSGWLPRLLGQVLIAGGVGYLISVVVTYSFPGGDLVAQLLTLPSVIGELWIMGYLVIVGLRPGTSSRRKALP